MEFNLTIKLGNEAMQTGPDIAEALQGVASSVDAFGIEPGDGGAIVDINGNRVGEWKVSA